MPSKFPRVVRDLAHACRKQVRLEMEGKETELDKTLIEAIRDPLTHLVRNSVDHGIEPSDVRTRAGKPPEGRLLLRAYHEGGQVLIEIVDDGGGIDPDRVRRKAAEGGLLSPDQIARLHDREVINLIFLPGFSTAEKISNVSGRGVGMDVVRTNIERTGGAVDIQSTPGKGTTIRIKIPLTLAIIPALIVRSDGDRFAIPQVSLQEVVRLDVEKSQNAVEWIHGVPVYRLRGRLLPLVYLNDELAGGRRRHRDDLCLGRDSVNIVVLQLDGHQFGLVVDQIVDTQEIVVKPLGPQLKGIPTYAGATIMGDGKVVLILDVLGIARRAGVFSEVRDRLSREEPLGLRSPGAAKQSLLIVGLGEHGRAAIPLSMVARLEEIRGAEVEYAANREVVQYCGEILPLVRLADLLPGGGYSPPNERGSFHVVVYSDRGRTAGLIVDRIIDIVEGEVGADTTEASMPTVVQNRVTDLLNVHELVQAVLPLHGSDGSWSGAALR
jgi:two-component system chemotaxis sensor kinase CheA